MTIEERVKYELFYHVEDLRLMLILTPSDTEKYRTRCLEACQAWLAWANKENLAPPHLDYWTELTNHVQQASLPVVLHIITTHSDFRNRPTLFPFVLHAWVVRLVELL